MEFKEAEDPRIAAIPDSHGHAKGEHKPFAEERPIPYTARMLFLWFYHACRRGQPRFMMVADHMNYLTFEDPAAVNLVRRALKLAQAGDLYGAAETAGVELGHAQVVSEGLRRGMRYAIGAEVDNDPRSRPDAQNIVDAMRPDGMIRSVHFLSITHPQHGENWMWPFDNPEFKDLYEVLGTEAVWETYMATLLDAIEKLPGHIVGHFYVPAVFGHWPDDATLEGYEDKLVDACAERGMAIELNSRYLYKHYLNDEGQLEKFRAVHMRLLGKAVAKGVGIAVGSDAHSPKDQGRGFDVVLEMLDAAEINEIAFPLGGRLARVALRATEEILKQFAPPEPEPPPPPPEPIAEPVAAISASADRGTGASTVAKSPRKRPSRAKAAIAERAAEAAASGEPSGDDLLPAAEAPVLPADGTALAATKARKGHVPELHDTTKPEPKSTVGIKPVAVKKAAAKTPAAKTAPPAKKASAPKKAAAKSTAPAKKSVTAKKRVPAKKVTAKKAAPAKKVGAKKAVARKAVATRSVAKKTAAKKTIAKRPVAKKAVKKAAKKAAPVKRAAPKRAKPAPARRVPAKKATAKKPARRPRR